MNITNKKRIRRNSHINEDLPQKVIKNQKKKNPKWFIRNESFYKDIQKLVVCYKMFNNFAKKDVKLKKKDRFQM